MTAYENNLEHLLDELQRIDLIVRLHLEKYRAHNQESTDYFQGLYVSEDEVNTILQTLPYELKVNAGHGIELEKIKTISNEIKRKKIESIEKGKELRLHILSELFNLDPFEVDALLICLAPELDMRYEKLYSYLQNDVTRKRPTVDLLLKLLSFSWEERLHAREKFSASAPLIKNRILHLIGDVHSPLLSKSIKVDERIISFLSGSGELEPGLRNFSEVVEPKRNFNDIILTDDSKNTLMRLIKQHSDIKLIFYFHGAYGTGKKMAAEAVCKELGMPLLVVDSKVLKEESSETLILIIREALLQNSSLYIEGFDALFEKDAGIIEGILKVLDSFPGLIFLSGERQWEPAGILKNHSFIRLEFPVPSFAIRKCLWESFLNGNASEDVDINALASKFNLSGGQIKDAIFTARNVAMAKKSIEARLSLDDLYYGCRSQSNKSLISFAKKITPHYTWDDIVLLKDTKEHLKDVCGYIKYRGTVYAEWGFDKKLSLGKGLNVLFSGPSGTGKTMAAEVIADEVKLDLYKIDLSNVVSKYIGETEKNLSKIFKEAETSNAILFFDEADALFGKRSEVKDAHDRYANIEIGYLLQKMEEYEGAVLLATNLSKNIDDAFLRRMQFMIEFPFPDELQRMGIWKGIFPTDAPLAQDIDLKFLSEKLKLAGGNIKNIALSAAFHAAEESGAIGMHHIMHAAKREYQKIGRPFLKADFEPYYKLTEEE